MLSNEDLSKIKKELDELDRKLKLANSSQYKMKDFRLLEKSLYVWCILNEFEVAIDSSFKINSLNDCDNNKLWDVYEFLDIFNLSIDAHDNLDKSIKIIEDFINESYAKIKIVS